MFKKRFKPVLAGTRAGVTVLLVLVMTFSLGAVWGGYTKENQALQLENAQNTLISLQQENETRVQAQHALETRFALLQLEHEALNEAYSRQMDALDEAQRTLAFYENVVAPEKRSEGLVVDGLAIERQSTADTYRLQLVLLQNFPQRAVVKGLLKICIIGEASAGAKDICSGSDYLLPEGDLKYRFKFFQAVDIAITLPADFRPQSIIFSSDVYRYTTKRQTFSWSVNWDEAVTAAAIGTD